MGADAVVIVESFEHEKTDTSDVDAVVFADGTVPPDMLNGRKTATVEWVKQCLVCRSLQDGTTTIILKCISLRSRECTSHRRYIAVARNEMKNAYKK
jgi:hypothetical protein